jgi:hypothetical protein
MTDLNDCRLFETANLANHQNISEEEFREQFNEFQEAVLELLFGTSGYVDIDSKLQDALFRMEYCDKKKIYSHTTAGMLSMS